MRKDNLGEELFKYYSTLEFPPRPQSRTSDWDEYARVKKIIEINILIGDIKSATDLINDNREINYPYNLMLQYYFEKEEYDELAKTIDKYLSNIEEIPNVMSYMHGSWYKYLFPLYENNHFETLNRLFSFYSTQAEDKGFKIQFDYYILIE